jgi:hypothetical protein
MKLSALIEELQGELAAFGDMDVVMTCDDLNDDDNANLREIGALGWYGGTERRALMIICSECHQQAIAEEHMFDGDPE